MGPLKLRRIAKLAQEGGLAREKGLAGENGLAIYALGGLSGANAARVCEWAGIASIAGIIEAFGKDSGEDYGKR